MKLESLYRRTKTSAIQVCNISVSGAVISVEFGQLDGKLQVKETECFPVNVGKSNETSAEGQAISEAKSKWANKVKSGYSTNVEAPVTVQLPQLVKKFQDHKENIIYPAYSVVKLNGINGTYWLMTDGSLKLTSRGGEEYPTIPHLEDQVRAEMAFAETTCLNVELYIHGEHLQDISGAVKKTKPLSSRLTFNTFELPLVGVPYERKVHVLGEMLSGIEITEVLSEAEVDALHADAVANGYEGTVIYNKHAVYAFNERSSNVLKYKIPADAEFKVVGFNIDKNKHAVYVCESKGGNFNVKRVGKDAERLSDAAVAESNIGRWLNVEFETFSKAGKPLKPVGQHFRLCDEDGNPLE